MYESTAEPKIFDRCIWDVKYTFWDMSRSSSYKLLSSALIGLAACQAAGTVTSTTSITSSPSTTPSSITNHDIIATIPLDWKPTLIAQGNGVLWVVGQENHFVARLNPVTNQLIGEPTTLPEPIYDIVASDGSAWVTGDTMVTRLDPATGEITATLRADQFSDGMPFRLTVGDGSIWLLNLQEGPSRVHKIDTQTNQFVGGAATIGIEALGIAFGAGSIWTANHDDATVSRVDPTTNGLVATIQLSFEPHYIYFNPDDGLVWVANYHAKSVSRIDPKTNQLIGEPLKVPFAPEWMTSGANKIWIIPSRYAAGDVPQTFEFVAEFDVTNLGEANLVRVKGRPMDAIVSAGSLWITTQVPNQVLRLNLP